MYVNVKGTRNRWWELSHCFHQIQVWTLLLVHVSGCGATQLLKLFFFFFVAKCAPFMLPVSWATGHIGGGGGSVNTSNKCTKGILGIASKIGFCLISASVSLMSAVKISHICPRCAAKVGGSPWNKSG